MVWGSIPGRATVPPPWNGQTSSETHPSSWSVGTRGSFLGTKHEVDHASIYRVSQEECARPQESVPYVKLYRYNPKHL